MRGKSVFGLLWLLLAGCPSQASAPLTGDGGVKPGTDGGTCVQRELCVLTSHWDTTRCMCVPNAAGSGGAGTGPGGSGGTTCIQNQLCIQNSHWDSTQCACVPDTGAAGRGGAAGHPGSAGSAGGGCVQNQLCARGLHWDGQRCMCVMDAGGAGAAGGGGMPCIQNQACVRNSHWDPMLCKCTPDAPDAGQGDVCATATDCHGILPHICAACANLSDAGPTPISGCTHWSCKNGRCVTSICD